MKIEDILRLPKLSIKDNLQLANNARVEQILGAVVLPTLVTPKESDFIGIEVEIEGIKVQPDLDWLLCWHEDIDGSLKDFGKEYQSLILRPRNVIPALRALKRAVFTANPLAYFGPRAAFHYHLNVRDLTPQELGMFLALYKSIEFLLFHLTTEARLSSNYCVPLNDTVNSSTYDLIYDNFDNSPDKLTNTIQTFGGKYAALGLFRLLDLGTVEFRHLHSNLDISLLHKWIAIGLNLKNSARRIKPEELKQTLEKLNSHSRYTAYVENIIGSSLDTVLPYISVASMSEAISNTKEIFSSEIELRLYNVLKSPLGKKVLSERGII